MSRDLQITDKIYRGAKASDLVVDKEMLVCKLATILTTAAVCPRGCLNTLKIDLVNGVCINIMVSIGRLSNLRGLSLRIVKTSADWKVCLQLP